MRLFIAINLSSDVKDALSETIANLRHIAQRGRYSRWDNLHLTLAFIGESDRIDDITAVMTDVAERAFQEPLRITLSGAGSFKGRDGDTHWIGVQKTPELNKLAEALATALRNAGFEVEKRRFSPHITIGRKVVVPAGAEVQVFPVSMLADHISLMRSDLYADGAEYTEIARVDCG
jgi:2'-5' RNA ligase